MNLGNKQVMLYIYKLKFVFMYIYNASSLISINTLNELIFKRT